MYSYIQNVLHPYDINSFIYLHNIICLSVDLYRVCVCDITLLILVAFRMICFRSLSHPITIFLSLCRAHRPVSQSKGNFSFSLSCCLNIQTFIPDGM